MLNLIVKPSEDRHLQDINYLNSIQKDFKLNSLECSIIDGLIYDGNIVAAYGIVKRMAEAIMLINPKSPRLVRAKALRELMSYAESASAKDGCEQLQCFVRDPNLASLLEKQMGFIRSKDIILVKNLEHVDCKRVSNG